MFTLDSTKKSQYTLTFMVILSFVCALILSVLASALQKPQEIALELDRSQQMLIATQTMSPYGYFQVQDQEGKPIPAKLAQGGRLIPSEEKIIPNREQVLEVYRQRIHPFLVNNQGEPLTFEQAGIDQESYINEHRKTGYYLQPLKLIYRVTSNPQSTESKEEPPTEGYVIPVNGMGLWDAIYGYLAIKPDGNTVIGASWYDQKETPGLGANITEPDWLGQFPDKRIFQAGPGGKIDLKTDPLGLAVIKGKVNELLANSPKALNSLDGMAGATLTGNGVTNAYHDVLAAYRPFLIRLHEQSAQNAASKP